jgi:hypothetical protein
MISVLFCRATIWPSSLALPHLDRRVYWPMRCGGHSQEIIGPAAATVTFMQFKFSLIDLEHARIPVYHMYDIAKVNSKLPYD